MTHLNAIVESVKEQLLGHNDYCTVIITVLLGKEEEVIEAESTIEFDSDNLPCKSATIKLGNWRGKEKK